MSWLRLRSTSTSCEKWWLDRVGRGLHRAWIGEHAGDAASTLSLLRIGYQEGVAPYLKEIVPPVLACFTDQDARVRYYACESMYNIAKVAKGEILLFFNDIFDALSKVSGLSISFISPLSSPRPYCLSPN